MISFLFLAVAKPQEDALARYEQFFKGLKSVSVSMDFTMSGITGTGSGSFMLKKPGSMLFRMKIGKSDFSFSITDEEAVAIENSSKTYREYGPVGRLFLPEDDISTTPNYSLPVPLLAGSVRAQLPDGVKFTNEGKETVGGVPTDVVKTKYAVQGGMVTVVGKIDAQGKLIELDKSVQGEERSYSTKTIFKNYRLNENPSDSAFSTPIPVGYVAATLPPGKDPVDVGEKWPFEGWKSSRGGASLASLAANKVLFAAVGDSQCEVTQNAAAVIAEFAKKVEAKGGVCAAINLDPAASRPVFAPLPQYSDPTGKLENRIRAPGTPLFFLVSPKGRVTRVWYGFGPSNAAEFQRDMLEWVDKSKQK